MRRTDEKYGVIQMTLVDTWASTAAGAFALSENNLYTSDAFYEYFNHLDDNGILVFTRWAWSRRANPCGWSRWPARRSAGWARPTWRGTS